MNDTDPIPNELELQRLLAAASIHSVETFWTRQLVSIQARKADTSPFAVTKRLPITYGQLKHLLTGLGVRDQ